MPWLLSNLARAYGDFGELDDARRCIDEATTTMQTSNQRWCEAETNRIAGEISLLSPKRDVASAEAYFERALTVARQRQVKSFELRAATRPRTPLARPGQGAASARTACSGLRVVYGGVRHARSAGREGASGRVGVGYCKSPKKRSETLAYVIYCAPLAVSVEPVIKPASSAARNTTQRPISSGSPRRPIGIVGRILFSRTSFGTACTISVLM